MNISRFKKLLGDLGHGFCIWKMRTTFSFRMLPICLTVLLGWSSAMVVSMYTYYKSSVEIEVFDL